MVTKERPLKRIEALATKAKEGSIHSRLLTPPPLTPEGFTLHLANNIPSQLTPQEAEEARQKIERDRVKLTRRHAFYDTLKVNITGLSVTTSTNSQGQIEQVINYTTAPSWYLQHRSGIDNTTPEETARKLSHSGA